MGRQAVPMGQDKGQNIDAGFDFSEDGLRRRWYRIGDGQHDLDVSDPSVRWAAAFESLDCLAKQVAFSNCAHSLVEHFFDGFPPKSAKAMFQAVIYPEPNKPLYVITNHAPYQAVRGIGKVWCEVDDETRFPQAVTSLCRGDAIERLDEVPSFLGEKTLDAMVAAAISLGRADSVREIVTFAGDYKGPSRAWVQESIAQFVNATRNPKALTVYLDVIRSYSGKSLKQFADLIQCAGEYGNSDEEEYGPGHCVQAMKLMVKALAGQPAAVLTAIASTLSQGYGGSPDFCTFPKALNHPAVRAKLHSLRGEELKDVIEFLACEALDAQSTPKAALRNAIRRQGLPV